MYTGNSKIALALAIAMMALVAVAQAQAPAPAPAPAPAAKPADGKSIFLGQKCIKCHEISAEAITSLKKPPEVPVDLSGVGASHDVPWFKQWVTKQIDKPSRANPAEMVRHKIKFGGTDADLDMLAHWLKTLTKKGK